MRLDSFKQKTRLSTAAAIEQLRTLLARRSGGTVAQQLDLSELEDRILLSASPAAVMVDAAPAGESAEMASPLAAATEGLFESSQTAAPLEARAQEDEAAQLDAPLLDEFATSIQFELDQSEPLQVGIESAQSEIESAIERAATEVIFIDESAEDFEQLVADLESQRDAGRAIDFFVLNSEQDGVDQIAATLERYSDLDAVHIVSHGTDGAVKLGGSWLRIGSLDGYAGTIAGWGSSIDTAGDILFYGCDLASSSRGQTLVESVAALTGADVAASTDDTGHALLGGTGTWSM